MEDIGNTGSKEDEAGVEERLNFLMTQLQLEVAIFERIVYKNKNQHRRGSYFQYLMKVRRDLRLLESVKLKEILTQCFYVIDGKKPRQKVSALESLKKSVREAGKYNFMERLLGAARLLSEMVEPMLKAASKISTMLAQSFFVGFSVTVLAIIARLRVLVQQILVDVVSVFNEVSSISNKPQSIKIIQEGVDVFREYYPKQKEMITLECMWETDKYVLIERTSEVEFTAQDIPPITDTVKYTSIEAFLEDAEPADKSADSSDMNLAIISDGTEDIFDVASSIFNKENQNGTYGDRSESKVNGSTRIESIDGHNLAVSEPTVNSISSKRKLDSNSRVAFVSVKKPAPSADDRKDTLVQKANFSCQNSLSDVLISDSQKSSVL